VTQTKKRWKSILWVEAFGFSLLIVLSWLTELGEFPHRLWGEAFIPNWHRAILRTVVIGLIWLWVHLVTRRLLKRLHYLENFLLICSWCRKVCYRDEWQTMEKYFDSNFHMHTSHGMCPECMKNELKEVAERKALRPDMFKKSNQ
jgi:hypothetical protein